MPACCDVECSMLIVMWLLDCVFRVSGDVIVRMRACRGFSAFDSVRQQISITWKLVSLVAKSVRQHHVHVSP